MAMDAHITHHSAEPKAQEKKNVPGARMLWGQERGQVRRLGFTAGRHGGDPSELCAALFWAPP